MSVSSQVLRLARCVGASVVLVSCSSNPAIVDDAAVGPDAARVDAAVSPAIDAAIDAASTIDAWEPGVDAAIDPIDAWSASPIDAAVAIDAASVDGGSASVACVASDINADPTLSTALGALSIQLGSGTRVLSMPNLLPAAGISAVSIAVHRPGAPILAGSWGDSLSGATLNADTMFQAGSISKAVWSMSLLARGDSSSWLDTDVRTALPELPSSHPVTPAMLLTHTSGASVHGYLGYPPDNMLPNYRQIVLGISPSLSPAVTFGPSGPYSYSGGGFVTLAWWFQQSEGMDIGDFTRTTLFADAGLRRSMYEQPLPATEVNHACGNDATYLTHACAFVYPEEPAAGLWTTPSDLTCLSTYLVDERPDVLTLARSRAVTISGWPQAAGLGIRHRALPGGGHLFEHGGVNTGYCNWWVFFDDGRSVAVMTNTCTATQVESQIVQNLCRALGWPCGSPGFLP